MIVSQFYQPLPVSARSIDWKNRPCSVGDPERFFKDDGEKGSSVRATKKAIAECRTCPIQDECLAYAYDNKIDHGVWGGWTGPQRVAKRRKQNRKAAA